MNENNKLFKLSPSDFKYLWEDCKRCYYSKVVNGIELPSIGMPGIFGKMSGQVQIMAQKMGTKSLHPDLPDGIFEFKEGYLRSKPIPPSNKSFVSGRFDLLAKFSDGTHGLIDLKITDPKEENLYKFSNQLHAYKFALENAQEGDRIKRVPKVSQMGLLIISPESVEFKSTGIVFNTTPVWIPIKEDMDLFYTFIEGILKVITGKIPEENESCKWCVYRNKTVGNP